MNTLLSNLVFAVLVTGSIAWVLLQTVQLYNLGLYKEIRNRTKIFLLAMIGIQFHHRRGGRHFN